MLKSLLMAGAAIIALPAVAQEAPTKHKDKPAATAQQKTEAKATVTDDAAPNAAANAQADVPAQSAAPAAPAPATPAPVQPAPVAPAPAAPASLPETAQAAPPAPAAQDATAAAPAAPAAPAPGQPATTASQVAQVVQAEFAGYDKDKSGVLSKAEFTDWMGALRKASDATFNPASPEAASWSNQAFAGADTDKDTNLTQAELTAFLSKGK